LTASSSIRPLSTSAVPPCPPKSPTLGLNHLQFEALLAAARQSPNPYDFALVATLGLQVFEATSSDIADLGEEHDHRVLQVCGKGTKVVLVPLPPAVGQAIDQATGSRNTRPILLSSRGTRMDRHTAACEIDARVGGLGLVELAAEGGECPGPPGRGSSRMSRRPLPSWC